jgi:hypothetical protein
MVPEEHQVSVKTESRRNRRNVLDMSSYSIVRGAVYAENMHAPMGRDGSGCWGGRGWTGRSRCGRR